MNEVIAKITIELLNERIDKSNLNKLAGYLLSMAKKYSVVNFRYSSITDFNEIAVNAIASLFEKDNNSNYYLRNTLLNWKDLSSSEEIIYALNKTVWKACEQAFQNMIKEESPVFSKIYNNLTTCIYNENYFRIKLFERTYVCQEQFNLISANIIADEDFIKIPADYFLAKQKQLFEGLFLYLKDNLELAPALPLNLLCRKIETIYMTENITGMIHPENSWTAKETINNALHFISTSINTHYVCKGKLTTSEAEAILLGFRAMSADLSYGLTEKVTADYFRKTLNNVSHKDYYTNYHGIVKFLLKKYRDFIARQIEL